MLLPPCYKFAFYILNIGVPPFPYILLEFWHYPLELESCSTLHIISYYNIVDAKGDCSTPHGSSRGVYGTDH